MKIFLMRHAPASYGPPDPDRPLTREGRQLAARMAAFMRERPMLAIDAVWSSPYLRARQTAEPMLCLPPRPAAAQLTDALLPGADPDRILREIRGCAGTLLLVGHNPHLGRLARRLLGMGEAAPHLPFKKGALMAFEGDPGSRGDWQLLAYLTPKSLGW
jgi:phosphohistidine phosphatase